MSFAARSPWIVHYDGSSCNGCDIEVAACLAPRYDIERFGAINAGNPKHADLLLITGAVNRQNLEAVKAIYAQMGDPKAVVAVGVCAANGNIFRDCYNTLGGASAAVPVDVYVPGCAARPEAIIAGVIRATEILEEKERKRRRRSAASGH